MNKKEELKDITVPAKAEAFAVSHGLGAAPTVVAYLPGTDLGVSVNAADDKKVYLDNEGRAEEGGNANLLLLDTSAVHRHKPGTLKRLDLRPESAQPGE